MNKPNLIGCSAWKNKVTAPADNRYEGTLNIHNFQCLIIHLRSI